MSRERTQGRPEGPAPAAPPSFAGWSRCLPARVIRGGRARASGGGFPARRRTGPPPLPAQGPGHILFGHLIRAGLADREADVGVLNGRIGADLYRWQWMRLKLVSRTEP